MILGFGIGLLIAVLGLFAHQRTGFAGLGKRRWRTWKLWR